MHLPIETIHTGMKIQTVELENKLQRERGVYRNREMGWEGSRQAEPQTDTQRQRQTELDKDGEMKRESEKNRQPDRERQGQTDRRMQKFI